ncbi:MAG: DUF373 family protein [Candidatus Aenigmarchaeota archaeon]|nr:DUF373 family protein [Candidatus Aenigmarchaeota archaeon]
MADRMLVLTVDRDDDIGRKAGVKGPVIGREQVIKAATAFAIADPEDSDMNAIFQAVKLLDEVKKQYPAEVAILTGHRDVGLKSDRIIADQLSQVLKKFPASGVIFISDGTEDEHVMPLIQSRLPILSVRRVIVKQSEQLETGYYKIKDFLKESLDNPKFSRLVFGLPAILLLLLGLFGFEGVRYVMGALGVYLLIKGFKLEAYVMGGWREVSLTASKQRFAFILYCMAAIFLVLGIYQGYLAFSGTLTLGYFEILATIVAETIFIFYLAGLVGLMGHRIAHGNINRAKIAALAVFGFSIAWVMYNAAQFIIDPHLSGINFLTSIIGGFILIFIALIAEWKS